MSVDMQIGEVVQRYIVEFFEKFKEKDKGDECFYVEAVKSLAREETTTLYVNFRHFDEIDESDGLSFAVEDLKQVIQYKYVEVLDYLHKAVGQFMRKGDRKFCMAFYHFNTRTPLRQLNTGCIGDLREITGTVTRTTECKTELLVGTFQCGQCETTISNVAQEYKFTRPVRCPNAQCNNRTNFLLMPEAPGTAFGDWQRIRIQESEHDIPAGSMPRTLDVIVRDEVCETCKAGDKIAITGCLIVVPDVPAMLRPGEANRTIKKDMNRKFRTQYVEGVRGLKDMGSKELNYKMMYLGSVVKKVDQDAATLGSQDDQKIAEHHSLNKQQKERLDQIQDALETEVTREVEVEVEDPNTGVKKSVKKLVTTKEFDFEYIANAIAPNVFGQMNIKKGILLQLVGGVQKMTAEGIKLRSDLNVCLVGDPSTAKSQFLKYVSNLMPRSIYTSGKTSTAAGLTASVTRDSEAQDMVIEPGALMLADNGICCIDEFDKMDPKDQSAIHEAMEQQTITLSKAGIQATLNARTSILAAANPVGNQYDHTKPLTANINLTAPIMSRFDLFFVLRDLADDENLDVEIAKHILNGHMHFDSPEGQENQNMNVDEYMKDTSEEEQLRKQRDSLQIQAENEPENEVVKDQLNQKQQEVEAKAENIKVNYPVTQMELRSYIQNAKRIHPKITELSRQKLVRAYKKLRQQSARKPGAYPITVRQLESLIRLSEGIARIQVSKDILPEHVEQAFKLMQSTQGESGIGELITLEEDEEELHERLQAEKLRAEQEQDGDVDMNGDNQDGEDDEDNNESQKRAAMQKQTQKGVARKQRTLDFAEYKRMVGELIQKMDEVAEDEPPNDSITEEDLVNWYLELKGDELETEKQLNDLQRMVKLVIKRMVTKDRVLLLVEEDENDPTQNRLKRHPNFILEDTNAKVGFGRHA